MQIILKNFKCWKKKTFELGDSGVSLISGKSGAGKTTILEAIVFALFGVGTKLTTQGKKSCSVEFTFDEYTITRTKGPCRLVLSYQGKEYEDDAAQAIISQKFTENFSVTGYMRQNSYNSFVLLSPLEKLAFLERFAFKDSDIQSKKKKTQKLIREREKEYIATNSQLEMTSQILDEKSPPREVKFPIKSKNIEKSIRNHEKKLENNEKLRNHSQKGVEAYTSKINALTILTEFLESQQSHISGMQERLSSISQEADDDLEAKVEKLATDLQLCEKMKDFCKAKADLSTQQQKYDEMYQKEKARLLARQAEITEKLWKGEYTSETDVQETITNYSDFVNGLVKKQQMLEEIAELKEQIREVDVEKYQSQVDKLQKQIFTAENVMKCPQCDAELLYKDGELQNCEEQVSTKDLQKLKDKLEKYTQKLQKASVKEKKNQRLQQQIEIKQEDINSFEEEYETTGDEDITELQATVQEAKEYLQLHTSLQKELVKITTQLEEDDINPVLSEIKNHIQELQEIVQSNSDVSEEELAIIENEAEIRESHQKLSEKLYKQRSVSKEIAHLHSEIEKYETLISQRQADFIEKYKKIVELEVLTNKKQEYQDKVVKYNDEREQLLVISREISNYHRYCEELEEYNKWISRKDELDTQGKYTAERLNASKLLRQKISEAEAIAIGKLIEKINTNIERYLNVFFEDEPMSVQILPFKEDKKKNLKPQINLKILYKEMDCDINMLSGGELQRLVIAFNLAFCDMFDLPLVLLDECTSNLDQDTTQVIVEGIKEHFTDRPVIMIAHQVVSGMFDQIVNV